MNTSSSIRIALAALALGFAAEANAQYHLRMIPAVPSAGQPFLVVFDDSPCEDFFPDPPGLPPTFEVNGSLVTLAVDRLEIPNCGTDPVTFTIPVPGLPQGDYSLLLIGRALQSPNNYGELETVPLTIGPAVVRDSIRIPATGLGVLVLFGATLTGVAAVAVRSVHRRAKPDSSSTRKQ